MELKESERMKNLEQKFYLKKKGENKTKSLVLIEDLCERQPKRVHFMVLNLYNGMVET